MAVVDPDDLLFQADRLIGPSTVGPPKQTDLRRAISNAYYAIFHAVLTEAADDLIGKSHRASTRYALVYRSIDHKSLRRLCDDIQKTSLPPKYSIYSPKSGFGSDLVALAAAVADLHEKRHLADYDPLFRAKRSDASSAVATARAALSKLRNSNRASRKAFLSLLVFSPR
jgi:hypothetical protein